MMKIVFICSSLEPGKDGVGDYTRRLAGELIRQGHNVGIVALHDSHIDNFQHEIQVDQNSKINTLRLSSCISWRGKKQRVKKFIDDFDPEWLSLQFVSYGFHKKGLPFLLPNFLIDIGGNRKWHLNFHELWIAKSTLKHKVIALLQKKIVFVLIKALSPVKISTSIKLYKDRLDKYHVEILPLFGNIPLSNQNSTLLLPLNNSFKVVHFGTFSEDEIGFKRQIGKVILLAKYIDKEIDFIVCGNGGVYKDSRIKLLSKEYSSINVIDYDILSVAEISQLFCECDLGISRANYAYVGKSGTTQSMVEHGLPVLLRDSVKHNQKVENFYCFFDDSRTIVSRHETINLLNNTVDVFVKLINN